MKRLAGVAIKQQLLFVCGGSCMSAIRCVVSCLLAAFVSGCGTYVPEIQEFPGNSIDGELLVKNIVYNVSCEIADAVNYVIDQDTKLAPANGNKRLAKWFDDWGIQTTLSLSLDEKGSVNPVALWTPPGLTQPSQIFSIGGGANWTNDATRIEKLNSFNTVQQYRNRSCTNRPSGAYMLSSDLKLREWLVDVILVANTGDFDVPPSADGPWKSNVISHEVKFQVTTSGNLTPAWKLTRVSINQSGTFLSASRDRTHDLTITLGPMAKVVVATKQVRTTKGEMRTVDVVQAAPSAQAAEAHLASQIGSAVGTAVKSALSQ